jgi:hypothetical protein
MPHQHFPRMLHHLQQRRMCPCACSLGAYHCACKRLVDGGIPGLPLHKCFLQFCSAHAAVHCCLEVSCSLRLTRLACERLSVYQQGLGHCCKQQLCKAWLHSLSRAHAGARFGSRAIPAETTCRLRWLALGEHLAESHTHPVATQRVWMARACSLAHALTVSGSLVCTSTRCVLACRSYTPAPFFDDTTTPQHPLQHPICFDLLPRSTSWRLLW